MMFPRVSWKLTFFMVLVSALTLLLTAGLSNKALDEQFSVYLDVSQRERNLQVVELIKELYRHELTVETLQEQLDLLGLAGNVQIVLGETVFQGEGNQSLASRSGMMSRGRGVPMMHNQTRDRLVLADGSRLEMEIIPTKNPAILMEEGRFRDALNRSVIWAALISFGLALILSLIFSFSLTKPLQQLVKTVRKFGEGDLTQRTTWQNKDEFSYLSQEFNNMAANLQQLEKLRLKSMIDTAHEFRTPLTIIQSYLEAMNDGVVLPVEENFILILEEVDRLNLLLSGMEELSQIEKGLEQFVLFDFSKLLTKVSASFANLAAEKEIEFKTRISPNLKLMGDQALLETTLRNIVDNAIKYTPFKGEILLQLTKQGQELVTKITDTGIGISSAELPFVFERFYRTDLSRSRQTGGTGIGLAVASEIVLQHGGKIEVQSELGQGSTFIVRLPVNNS